MVRASLRSSLGSGFDPRLRLRNRFSELNERPHIMDDITQHPHAIVAVSVVLFFDFIARVN